MVLLKQTFGYIIVFICSNKPQGTTTDESQKMINYFFHIVIVQWRFGLCNVPPSFGEILKLYLDSGTMFETWWGVIT